MTAITTKEYRQIDVNFSLLNDLTARLRAAGARVSVRKLGKLHRITLVQEPVIATFEQILSYIQQGSNTANTQIVEIPEVTNTNVTKASDEFGEEQRGQDSSLSLPKGTLNFPIDQSSDITTLPKSVECGVPALSTKPSLGDKEFLMATTETTAQHKNRGLAELAELTSLTSEKLKELAATYKVAGRSKMKPGNLATKLYGLGLVTKEQLL